MHSVIIRKIKKKKIQILLKYNKRMFSDRQNAIILLYNMILEIIQHLLPLFYNLHVTLKLDLWIYRTGNL